jgi:transposase-like protein
MPRYRTAYPPEFRRQLVDLVRSGRTPEELAREFEPTAQSISTWVKQAERDAGKRIDGPTTSGLHHLKSWSLRQTRRGSIFIKMSRRGGFGEIVAHVG